MEAADRVGLASTGEGIEELVGKLDAHWDWLGTSGKLANGGWHGPAARSRRSPSRRSGAGSVACPGERRLDELAEQVAVGKLDPYAAADQLMTQSAGP